MATKDEKVVENIPVATPQVTVYQLPTIMENLGTPTLKAIAMVFDLNPIRLYSVAKTPKEGEIYDAKKYNWEAIERFVLKRLDPDKGIATLADVITEALKLDATLQLADGRRRTNAGGSNKLPLINVDGREMPVRKFPNFEVTYDPTTDEALPENERQWAHPANIPVILLKKDNAVYGIVHQTTGFTVLRPVGEDGKFNSETVSVISNSLLNLKGHGLSATNRKEVLLKYKAQALEAAAAAAEAPAVEAVTAE